MNNKKIISLICALAMIFSMFSAFTVVNADEAKGINLAGSVSKDNKTITIDATAVGTKGALSSFGIAVKVPAGVETANVKATSESTPSLTTNVKDGVLTVAFLDMSGAGVTFADNKLCKIEITLPTALTAPIDFTLEEKSSIADEDGEITVKKGMTAATVKVAPEGLKPAVTRQPLPSVEPSSAPDAKPTDVPAVGKGINLSSSLSKDGKTVTIDATAVGTKGALSSFGIAVKVPAGVETANVKATSESTPSLTTNVKDGVLTVAFLDMSGAGVTFADNKLCKIEITLPEALTAPYAFTLEEKSSIADEDGETTVKKGMTAASTVVDPTGGEDDKTVKKEIPLNTILDPDKAIAAEADENSVLYVTVQVMPEEAVYGRDYVAVYNGKELSEYEYACLINGMGAYEGVKMSDVIKNLVFKVYSGTPVTVTSIAAQLNDEFTGLQVDEGTQNVGKTESTPKPVVSKASITVKGRVAGKDSDTKKVTVGKNITLTAEVTLPADATEVEGKAWSYEVDKDKADTYVEELKAGVDEKDAHKYVVKLETLKTISKLPVVFSYKYIDKDGEEATATATANVQIVKEETTSGSGSNSSSNGGSGSIANGALTNGNQNTGAINFKDIDAVPWAQDAILALVEKGVINGRDNVTFDPNGTVTRAEFAKMVVLGFGLSGATQGNFSDVDYTQWYGAYVQAAYANDVISGYDDGTFRPNGLITRQEMAAMISRAIKAANKTLPATVEAVDFTDVTDADWGKAEIAALQQGGVINGMTATTYEPQSNATRAQAAVIIYRAITKAL